MITKLSKTTIEHTTFHKKGEQTESNGFTIPTRTAAITFRESARTERQPQNTIQELVLPER